MSSLCGQTTLKMHTELHAGKIPIHIELETVPAATILGVICHISYWQGEGPGRVARSYAYKIPTSGDFITFPTEGNIG